MIDLLVVICLLNFTYIMAKFVNNVQHIVKGKHRRMFWIREGLGAFLFVGVLFSLRFFKADFTALVFSAVYLFKLWSKDYYWNLEYKDEEQIRRHRRRNYFQFTTIDHGIEVFDVPSFYQTLDESGNWIELVEGLFCRRYDGELKYNSIFAIEIKGDEDFDFNDHKHELAEFVDVVEGELTLIDGRVKKAGQTFIIDGDQVHTMRGIKGTRSIHYFVKL